MKPVPASAPESPGPVQLRLATGGGDTAISDALTKTGLHLLAIQRALEVIHAVAEHRVELDADSVERLRHALNTLDAVGPLPGRLGYLTRLLNAGPVGDYAGIVDDLTFAVHLNDKATP
jgi:hypothetical protein